MLKEIIINSSASQTRVAITEDGNLVDFFVDYPENRRTVGDIYLGQVARVLPGIKAAFIDIGLKHDAFLHFSDIGDRTKDLQNMLDSDDDDQDEYDSSDESAPSRFAPRTINGVPVLTKGEHILVQITKEPVSNKGVRVTSSISIPGRFCVLLPMDNKIGISKKVTDFKERKRLRSIARSILPKNCGLIIRTVAKNQPEDAIMEDLKMLRKTWEQIEASAKSETPPKLVYQDVSTTSSVIRDLFTPDISKVYIDSKKLHKEIRDYVGSLHSDLANKIELYKRNEPIFDGFNIEQQIRELFGRKVFLKSGGYLIIEHTEAMVVIDVNSGKYAASKDQELNSLRTDLEASREIARQLRLRDIGGLIVIDFIDLEDDRNRRKVFDELRREFRKDRAKVSLLPMSDFGLIEITRQRIRQNILQAMKEVCPQCMGTGSITKNSHVIYNIEDWIKKARQMNMGKSLTLKCHPYIGWQLKKGFPSDLTKMQWRNKVRINLIQDETTGIEQFKFFRNGGKDDITEEVLSGGE